jgi:hypothetical protein
MTNDDPYVKLIPEAYKRWQVDGRLRNTKGKALVSF